LDRLRSVKPTRHRHRTMSRMHVQSFLECSIIVHVNVNEWMNERIYCWCSPNLTPFPWGPFQLTKSRRFNTNTDTHKRLKAQVHTTQNTIRWLTGHFLGNWANFPPKAIMADWLSRRHDGQVRHVGPIDCICSSHQKVSSVAVNHSVTLSVTLRVTSSSWCH